MLPPSDVLDVIADAFIGPLTAPPRAVADSPGQGDRSHTVLAMPALRHGGLAIVKVVNAIGGQAGGLSSHLLAFDTSGDLLAVIEAHQLTARRTAAASVLAAKTLGASGARHLAVLGAGRQARAHIEAYAAAMPLEALTLWARREEAARDLAQFASELIGSVRIASTPEQAVDGADVIASATPARSPLIRGDMVAAGTHVDLVGGFRPTMREADDSLIARAAVVADTPAALVEAGDLVQPIASGAIERDSVLMLSALLAGRAFPPPRELTLFKSVGHAGEDLVVAELLLERLGLIDAPSRTPADEPSRTLQGVAAHG